MKSLYVFWIILKITFTSYGGGNAVMPTIKRESLKQGWMTNKEFDELIVVTNSIPGSNVVEALSYVAIKQLGKFKGAFIALLAILPHLLLPLILYIVLNKYIPSQYMIAIKIAIMPVICGVLLSFAYRYFKTSKKELMAPLLWFLIICTLSFCLFVPAPFNVAAIVMILVILIVYFYEMIKSRRIKE